MKTLSCFALLVAATTNAFALKPAMHADITSTSCKAVGLPHDFCTRSATEDYDTDSREWDDLRAHAQIDDGETACIAADRTAARMYGLGAELRAALSAAGASSSDSTVGKVGALVGRAMHTLQDNCAHHGMPNPQHAWFSLGDFCDGTDTSPDVQDDAFACARTETDAAMKLVADAVARQGLASGLGAHSCPPAPPTNNHNNSGPPAICQQRVLPGPFDACDFLGRAKDWDGIDRTWDNAAVVPAIRRAFAAGLDGGAAPAAICGGDERLLSPAVSEPVVDVSGGAPSCVRASVFCLGKADDAGDNPFADDPAPADGGCNTGRGSTGFVALALLAALARPRSRATPRRAPLANSASIGDANRNASSSTP